MGKKVPEIMAEERDKFVEGAQEQGYTEKLADSVFMLVEPFAGYAFNKAHSVSYGLVSYWTAYLKANFPAEYMAAFMNSYIGKKDRLISAVADCRRMGIPVFPPSVNSSFQEFTIEKTIDGVVGIRFGLAAIKNVGSEALTPLIEARLEHGNFDSLENLCKNGDIGSLNRKSIECLIMAGCLDEFGDRGGLLEVAEKINSLAQQEKTLRDSSQSTMFDMLGEAEGASLAAIDIPISSTSDHEKRMWEVELMGMSLSSSDHLANVMSKMKDDVQIMLSQLESKGKRGRSTIGGQVSTIVDRFTRDNKPFKVITLELLDGSLEAVVWEDALKKSPDIWDPGKIVTVTGTIRERDGDITISVQEGSEVDLDKVLNSGNVNEIEQEKRTQTSHEVPVSPETNGTVMNGNGKHYGNGHSPHINGVVREKPISEVAHKKKLVLFMKETEHPQQDKMLLDDVKRLLLGSSGSDEVGLEIESQGSLVVMDWKPVKVDASEELQEKLKSTLGEYGGVSVQSLMF
jgi:DNA polymerase-3 subunit alpha